MNTDKTWQWFGLHDPYYGVLTSEEFRGGAHRERFWQTGREHVDRLLRCLREGFHLPTPVRFRRALEFGAGVGRVLIPLAPYCEEIVGVDVSPAMRAEAQRNCAERRVTNATFVTSDVDLSAVSGTFDLIHSYIVLQHIAASRGYRVIEALLRLLAPDGIGALQLTYRRESPPHVELAYRLCTRVPLLASLLNVLVLKRPWRQPMAEMTEYDLGRVMTLLANFGCGRVHLEFSRSPGWYSTRGVFLFFQKTPVLASW